MTRLKAVVTAYHQSSQAKDHLKGCCRTVSVAGSNETGIPYIELQQDVKTRWWSTWQMCDSAMRMKPALVLAAAQTGKDVPAALRELTGDDWMVIEVGWYLLKPFRDAQMILEVSVRIVRSLLLSSKCRPNGPPRVLVN